MHKLLLSFSLIFFTLYIISCKKQDNVQIDSATAGYKIKLVEGGTQTDTTGNILKNPIIFKGTKDGDTIISGFIRIITYNCDNDPQYVDYSIGKKGSPYYQYQLLVPYQWRLNGIIGRQYLKAILLDSLKEPKDSITITAVGIPPVKGWYSSGCIPQNTFSVTFCKLPSGRILTALHQNDYPYYSDDEGSTWHSLKTLPGKYNITKMIATPLNEVFLSVSYEGMFYSKDGGQNWEERNTGLPVSGFWGNIQYTKSGKLFTLTLDGVYTSSDKGLNWHKSMQGLNYYAGFSDAFSISNGNILAISSNHLVQSNDGGESWNEVYSISSTAGLNSLFVDDNDDIYIGVASGLGLSYGLYVSKDNGQTWSKIYTAIPSPGFDQTISEITKQNSFYYFYSTSENILTKTNNFINYQSTNPPVGSNNGRQSFKYILSENGHLVISTEFYGLYYFIP